MGKYYFIILLCSAMISCKNQTKPSAEDNDLFKLINYPEWVDSVDCDMFDSDICLYPCLKLHKKTINEVDSLYGKPIETRIDTLYYGRRKDNKFYDPEISEMISKIPVAKITFTYRKESGYHLLLHFIDYNEQGLVFWGERFAKFMD